MTFTRRAVNTATIVAPCLSTPFVVVMALGSRHSGWGTPELVGMVMATFGAITALLWAVIFAFGLAYTWPDIVKRAAVGATIVLTVTTVIGLVMDLWDRETPSIGLLLLWPIFVAAGFRNRGGPPHWLEDRSGGLGFRPGAIGRRQDDVAQRRSPSAAVLVGLDRLHIARWSQSGKY